MKTFRTKKYEIVSSKIKEGEIKFAFLTDLHGLEFGENNSDLLRAVREFSPDAVLCTGDMLVRSEPDTLGTAKTLLKNLAEEYPVYLSLGNHEYKLLVSEIYESMRETYKTYELELEEGGVHILHNRHMELTVKENRISVYGLELPLDYYDKAFSQKLTAEEIAGFLGERREDFSILLAHSPRYGKAYFSWGADLILSLSWGRDAFRRKYRACFFSSSDFSAFLLREVSERGAAYDRKRRSWGAYHSRAHS